MSGHRRFNNGWLGRHADLTRKRWRPMFAGALVPTLLHLILTFKIPESPRWPSIQRPAGRGTALGRRRFEGDGLVQSRM